MRLGKARAAEGLTLSRLGSLALGTSTPFVFAGLLHKRNTMRENRQNCFRNPGRAPYPHIGFYMLLLAIELCKGGEHACD